MKPPFAYYGGKTMLAPKIAALLPEHGHYVEPFAGSLAVLLAKEPAQHETVNDLNQDLVTFWRVLRDRPAELARVCTLTPHSRVEHRAAYAATEDELEQARRFWVRVSQGRSGRTSATGWRRTVKPHGGLAAMSTYLSGYVGRMGPVAERLARVTLECRPALELIEQFGAHDDVLLYVDPPYLASTRTGTGYQYEMAGEDDHRALAAALRACRASVVLSGYDSPLYAEIYDGWHTVEMSARANGGSARTEVLWSNHPLASLDEQTLPAA